MRAHTHTHCCSCRCLRLTAGDIFSSGCGSWRSDAQKASSLLLPCCRCTDKNGVACPMEIIICVCKTPDQSDLYIFLQFPIPIPRESPSSSSLAAGRFVCKRKAELYQEANLPLDSCSSNRRCIEGIGEEAVEHSRRELIGQFPKPRKERSGGHLCLDSSSIVRRCRTKEGNGCT